MSQPLLSNWMIEAIKWVKKSNPVKYPGLPLVILTKDTNGEERK